MIARDSGPSSHAAIFFMFAILAKPMNRPLASAV
jgi:hypothetical protein